MINDIKPNTHPYLPLFITGALGTPCKFVVDPSKDNSRDEMLFAMLEACGYERYELEGNDELS